MAPNTSSSVFNEAPPQPATESKSSGATDGGAVMVAPAAEPAALATSSASVSPASTVSTSSSANSSISSSANVSEERGVASSSHKDDDDCDDEEREQLRQLQMSRFARVSPAMLDGVKPTLGFRKSCLKRSNSVLPADISILKHDTPAPELPAAPAAPVQKNRRRCWECKVKVGLTAVKCRCEYTFCNKHRYAEEHKCTFDFKVSAKRKLEEENPRVVPLKVARIN